MRWADPEGMAGAVTAYLTALRARHPEIRTVYWYGSWVSGTPLPTSDVDFCIVVAPDARRPSDRIPDYLPDRFPTGVDLVVLTQDELDRVAERSPAWHRAITSGRRV